MVVQHLKTVQEVENGEDLFETKRLSLLFLGINKSIISVLHGMKKNFVIVHLMEHFDLNWWAYAVKNELLPVISKSVVITQ